MREARVVFDELPWEVTAPGARSKSLVRGGRKLRLVEFTEDFAEPGWCTKAHAGYVLEGRMRIAFPGRTEDFAEGDGIIIGGGEDERHRVKVIGPSVRLLLLEDA